MKYTSFSDIISNEFVTKETSVGDMFTTHKYYKKIRCKPYTDNEICKLNGSIKIELYTNVFHDDLYRVQGNLQGTVSYTIFIEALTEDGIPFKISTHSLTYEEIEVKGYYNIEKRLIDSWNSFAKKGLL